MDSSARRRPDRNAGPNAYHEDEVTVLTGPSKSVGIGLNSLLLLPAELFVKINSMVL